MPEFFNRRNYLIILGLVIISMTILTVHSREGENGVIHRAQRVVMAATSPLQAAVTTALQPIRDGWEYLIHFGDLKRENRELRKEVVELQRENTALRSLKGENDRLRRIIDLKEKEGYEGVAARAIGKPVSGWQSSIMVDRGLKDGIKRKMPVVVGGGLVGQVTEASQNVAKVTLLNDVQSGVSVQVKRTGEVGVVKGQLKNQRLVLQYISRDSDIKRGDHVVTSGLGGIFPKGIYVGKVIEVKQSVYSLHKIVEIASPVNFANLEEVLIIKHEPGFVLSTEED